MLEDHPEGGFRAAFTPETPYPPAEAAAGEQAACLVQPTDKEPGQEPVGGLPEDVWDPDQQAAENRARIIEAMGEHRALYARDLGGLEVTGAGGVTHSEGMARSGKPPLGAGHRGLTEGRRLRSPTQMGGLAGPLQQVGGPAWAAQQTEVQPTHGPHQSAGFQQLYRNKIEVLGSHLEPMQHHAPDRTAYLDFVRSVSPPHIKALGIHQVGANKVGTHSAVAASADSAAAVDGQPMTETQEGDGAGTSIPAAPADTETAAAAAALGGDATALEGVQNAAGEDEVPADGPAAEQDAVDGGPENAGVEGAKAASLVKEKKLPKQHPFREGAKQLPPSFPGHKLGEKHLEGSPMAVLAGSNSEEIGLPQFGPGKPCASIVWASGSMPGMMCAGVGRPLAYCMKTQAYDSMSLHWIVEAGKALDLFGGRRIPFSSNRSL